MEDAGETNSVELLYKYRALEPFEYVADIICRQQFYAAQFFDLNDPMEGLFDFEEGTEQEYLEQIKRGKERLRICSFSKIWDHPVLWSHYAGGFRGICIEVEVTRTDTLDFDLVDIEYSQTRIRFGNSGRRLVSALSKEILRQKARAWRIEKEVRALATDKHIPIDVGRGMRMTRILLGVRTPEVMQRLIRQMTPARVSVRTTKIGAGNKIEIGPEMPPERR